MALVGINGVNTRITRKRWGRVGHSVVTVVFPVIRLLRVLNARGNGGSVVPGKTVSMDC